MRSETVSSGEEIFGRIFEKGDIVFRQGESGKNMYIIQSGSVEVSRRDEDGKESVLALLEKDDFFGEMAIMQDDKRSATIKALQHTRLLPLTRVS
jgi:CRP-like cAMP-binding protein